MKFRSTRGGDEVGLEVVLRRGLAPDGGLYVPTELPRFDPADFDDLSPPAVAETLLGPFFAGSSLEGTLTEACRKATGFPIPAEPLDERAWVLELFHGPTCAFKDVGAQFLACCLDALSEATAPPLVLTATSGDTGAAVAAAIDRVETARAAVLFPTGGVSDRQRHQLTCWGERIASFAVDGSFDDCQAMVKQAFLDADLQRELHLTSANSISLGRLLPQMTYYATTALRLEREGMGRPGFIIPTGNLGNALACVWARAMGLPIGSIVLATNANQTIPDYLDTGEWRPRGSVATLASAMDVGNPSNMERLRHLFPTPENLALEVSAASVDDAQIRSAIRACHDSHGRVICPHTATAYHVWSGLAEPVREQPWVLVATAHPSKFEQIIEPIIGEAVPVPPELQALLDRPTREAPLEPSLDALAAALRERLAD